MPFEDVLARCIADLERGATVDDCLVNHPDHAQSLEPLLRTVVEFRTGPRPQLSAAAFARGREAVVAKARYHQRLAQPFFSPLGAHDPKWALAAPAMPAPAAPLHPPLRWSRPLVGKWGNLLASALVLLTVITLSRNVTNSLPGSGLYTVKQTVEQVYGMFMSVAGQEALWHARQVGRRWQELDRLARQGASDPALVSSLEEELQQALAASASLPPAEREAFYARWLNELRAVQPGPDAADTTVVTLGRILSTVERAAEATPGPQVLPGATATFTPTPTPEATASATLAPPSPTPPNSSRVTGQSVQTPTAGQVLLPTVTPSRAVMVSPTASKAVATATSLPPVATATLPAVATPTPSPAPPDDDDQPDKRHSAPAPTATPQPPAPTNTPVPTATATTVVPAATPTLTPVTPSPETPTGTPAEEATATVTDTTLPTTPAATDTDTPTPPSATTPLPGETMTPVEETPVATESTVTPVVTEHPTWPPRTIEPPTPIVSATPAPPTPESTSTEESSPTAEEPTSAPSEAPTDSATPVAETPTPESASPTATISK